MTPITIFTGFLGSGKTTLIRSLIEQNPKTRFGLIINEFGEVGIDGELVKTATSGEQIVEMSNGCMCCVVRSDLQQAVKNMIATGEVDYIIIETSGLAEPIPVAQTFLMSDLDGKIRLDAIICLIDCQSFLDTFAKYTVAMEQLEYADIIILNKTSDADPANLQQLVAFVSKINPEASLLQNDENFDTNILIDSTKWDIERVSNYQSEQNKEEEINMTQTHEHEDKHEHAHAHNEHKHEHNSVDEVVFSTKKILDPNKLDDFFQNKFPIEVVRAKGFVRLKEGQGGLFLFQMVGARKTLVPYVSTTPDFDDQTSRVVFIGKNLPKQKILDSLADCQK